MARTIDSATLAALAEPHVEWVVFVRLELDSGVVAFTSLLDDYDFDGHTYEGVGVLGNISEAAENSKLDPSRFDVTLSGINPSVLAATLNENYFNRPLLCHLGVRDQNTGSIIGSPFLFFAGTIDKMDCTYGEESSVTVQASDEISDWERPRIERYTDEEQRAQYPGDTGFRFVAQLSDKKIIWPESEFFQ